MTDGLRTKDRCTKGFGMTFPRLAFISDFQKKKKKKKKVTSFNVLPPPTTPLLNPKFSCSITFVTEYSNNTKFHILVVL